MAEKKPTNERAAWVAAITWERYLRDEVVKRRELWEGVHRTARVPAWAEDRAARIGRPWRMLVLAEDWCGDASNTVPVLARLAEAVPGVQIRILKRDQHPELMGRYLTNGTRSIPIVLLLDEAYQVVGHWGPRPRELQAFVLEEKRAGTHPAGELYKDVRRWYARDGGETTLRELLDLAESGLAGTAARTA